MSPFCAIQNALPTRLTRSPYRTLNLPGQCGGLEQKILIPLYLGVELHVPKPLTGIVRILRHWPATTILARAAILTVAGQRHSWNSGCNASSHTSVLFFPPSGVMKSCSLHDAENRKRTLKTVGTRTASRADKISVLYHQIFPNRRPSAPKWCIVVDSGDE